MRPRVVSETVRLDEKPVFEFLEGEVHLYNDRFEHKVTYPFDWHRSALSTIMPRKDNQKLTRFRGWLGTLFCFRINPFAMSVTAEKEELAPTVNLSNFPGWYRHLVQAYPKENALFLDGLRESIDGFDFLTLETIGENARLLLAEFSSGTHPGAKFVFTELSDGQRCLVCLYTILHFVVATGGTVIVDEPENFISLGEIQPWLMAATEAVEANRGQVILISHHPELINQWAPDYGVQFVREALGPVRVKEFRGEPESSLTPAELIARGWQNG
ncbi:MAG: AAA family ATPase [Bryobacterales bacterium]|nr:AAA family ATPase [Bryobacterales bacterium]